LESNDRLALDAGVRHQHGLVRFGFDGLRVHGIRLDWVWLDWHGVLGIRRYYQRLVCRRVERDSGLYGRHDGE
jgi:hypothetical protein